MTGYLKDFVTAVEMIDAKSVSLTLLVPMVRLRVSVRTVVRHVAILKAKVGSVGGATTCA